MFEKISDNEITRRGISQNIQFQTAWHNPLVNFVLLMTVVFIGNLINVFAQPNVEHTKDKADQTLKSNARVNPSTLAMELSIPISNLPGRAGNGMPLVFNYSSKVWRLQANAVYEHVTSDKTETTAIYGEQSVGGWTASYGVPTIDSTSEPYDCNGFAVADTQVLPTGCVMYYAKRMRVKLPDGSTHELRKDDTISTTAIPDKTGSYLSVDSSKIRLDWGTGGISTLFLPDGGYYLFDSSENVTTYFDRHGNRLDYNGTTKEWTDTMGRTLVSPFPVIATEGTESFDVPGLSNTDREYQLVWKTLSNGALISGDSLAYDSGTCGSGGGSYTTRTPSLFQNSLNTKICSGRAGYFDPVVLYKVILPNGSEFKFQYNKYGEIARIDYPTGGYERFSYDEVPGLGWESSQNQSSAFAYMQANRGVAERWVSSDGTTDEQHWQYAASYVSTVHDTNTYQVQITAPDGTVNKRFLHRTKKPVSGYGNYGFDTPLSGMEMETQVVDTSSQMRVRSLSEWEVTSGTGVGGNGIPQRDPRIKKQVSIIFEPGASSALATMSETTFDSNGDAQYFAQLNPTIVKRYNYIAVNLTTAQTADIATIAALFSSGDLANSSETDYLYDSNYKARNLVTLPTETRVKDAAGNVKAKSQISYDQASPYPIISAGTDTQWTDPLTNYRGNVTTTKSWTDISGNLSVETHAQYDNFGNLRKAWDAKGNLTETEYTSTYKYAYPTKVTSAVPDSGGTNGSSTAFETTSTYDSTTGLVLTTTDANGQTTTIEYDDDLLRPTKVTPPSSAGVTEMVYTDTPGSMAVKTKSKIDSTNYAESTVYADGLGRAIKSEKKDNAGNVFVETEYDNMGRVKKVTNPYRSGDTKLWTENTYDSLSRVIKVETPDSAEVTTAFDLSTSGTLATVVTVTDQASKVRRSLTNGLGQLIRVDEPNDAGSLGTLSSPNQATSYAYDTLSNLVTVTQGSQTRTFTYDSASRLKEAVNPESGTINYTYDNNSNLTYKQDARGVISNIYYDNLNRPISKTFSDGTPTITYFYDNPSVQFSKSKLTKLTNGVSVTEYTGFNNVGQVLNHQQIIDGQTYTTDYTYNLDGSLAEQTYPSGRIVKNTYGTDGDLEKTETKQSSGNWQTRADNFTYTASGNISGLKIGNGRWESSQFNSRLQPTQIALGTTQNGTDLWKVNYDFGTTDNNNNIKNLTITIPNIGNVQGFTAVQTFTYDYQDRLKTAIETVGGQQTWKQTYLYDRYGNRTFDLANTTIPNPSGTAAIINPQIDPDNNRFYTSQGYLYDYSGNLIQDAEGRKYIFNSENKQTEVRDVTTNQLQASYFYDADGRRVKKTVTVTDEQTIFVYDSDGDLVAEYKMSIAQSQTPTAQYLTTDHLGTPRVITDSNGDIFSRRDLMPFGEDITTGIGSRSSSQKYDFDNIRQKFTGKIRDNETGLDYFEARYYASKWGRFTTSDEFVGGPDELWEFDGDVGANPTFYAELEDPQTLNKYIYGLNNPFKYIDPNGHQITRSIQRIVPTYQPYTKELEKAQQQLANDVKQVAKDTWEGAKIVGNWLAANSADIGCPECQLYAEKPEIIWGDKYKKQPVQQEAIAEAGISGSPGGGGDNKKPKQSAKERRQQQRKKTAQDKEDKKWGKVVKKPTDHNPNAKDRTKTAEAASTQAQEIRLAQKDRKKLNKIIDSTKKSDDNEIRLHVEEHKTKKP